MQEKFRLILRGTLLLACIALTVACDRAARGAGAESGAAAQKPDEYFQIESVTSQPLAETLSANEISDLAAEDECRPPSAQSGLADGLDPLNTVVAVGEKIWKLIEAGRPVVSFKAPVVHALPYNRICWYHLEGWKPPQSSLWEVLYKNKFGAKVVRFTYRITYAAGGNMEGKGKYLANVTVTPADISVAWGYNFAAEAQVGRTLNLGTKDNPIAGIQLLVAWNVKTKLKEDLKSQSFFLSGDGVLKPY
jgi:hypothetical protein